jgi:glycosyltransferase involved in cell wall biosynthesis
MLAILTTHPIQYQVPLWQMLAADGRVPFEVWYLSEHATRVSRDVEFGKEFAWDIDMLKGYRYRILKTRAGATPNTFWRSRITESLPNRFRETKTKVLWVNGWQVAGYWQAVWAAHRAGVEVWMRGESNALRGRPAAAGRQDDKTTGLRDQSPVVSSQWSSGQGHGLGALKRRAKRLMLGQLFKRVDQFLCIGTANRELYRSYGVPESNLHMAMYAVDNERFARQAEAIRGSASALGYGATGRPMIRSQWGIPKDAFCVLFCGKFIPKKHPMDLVKAAQLLLASHPDLKLHLLFAGSGELGAALRAACNVVFDADTSQRSEVIGQRSEIGNLKSIPDNRESITDNAKPTATFAGFLNQTEVSRAYVAADCLVLPSDYDETWGLVVNEAMSGGLPCIISDRCGCAPDVGRMGRNTVFSFGKIHDLAEKIAELGNHRADDRSQPFELPSFSTAVDLVAGLYG